MPKKPRKYLDQVHDPLRVRGHAIRTEERYLDWVKRYILFHDKLHPSKMGAPEIAEFLTYLAVEKHISPSLQNQARGALLFLYPEVLHAEIETPIETVLARGKKRQPAVLPKDKARKVIELMTGTHQTKAFPSSNCPES